MSRFSFGPFLLDGEARTLLRDGKPVAVTAKIFDTLLLLVQRRGTLVEKDELLSVVWRGVAVEEANLTNSIYAVRRVLGDSPRHAYFIATISGRGYQFVADVTEITGASDQALSVYQNPIQTHSSLQSDARRRAIWPGVITAIVGLAAVLALVSGYHEPFRTPMLTPLVQLTNDGLPKNELVTDGTQVFYASAAQGSPSGWRLLEVPATGGASRSVPLSNGEMSPIALSPDRRQLMIEPSSVRQSNDGWKLPGWLWVQPLDGRHAIDLKLQAHDASWSPDGRQMAYAKAEQIGLARRDARQSVSSPICPAWHPGCAGLRRETGFVSLCTRESL